MRLQEACHGIASTVTKKLIIPITYTWSPPGEPHRVFKILYPHRGHPYLRPRAVQILEPSTCREYPVARSVSAETAPARTRTSRPPPAHRTMVEGAPPDGQGSSLITASTECSRTGSISRGLAGGSSPALFALVATRGVPARRASERARGWELTRTQTYPSLSCTGPGSVSLARTRRESGPGQNRRASSASSGGSKPPSRESCPASPRMRGMGLPRSRSLSWAIRSTASAHTALAPRA